MQTDLGAGFFYSQAGLEPVILLFYHPSAEVASVHQLTRFDAFQGSRFKLGVAALVLSALGRPRKKNCYASEPLSTLHDEFQVV